MKTKSALSYFGSDSQVAERLAAKLAECNHVTIPFVGGASILPFIAARAIVCNDLNTDAITFYRVMSGELGLKARGALITRCRRTLSHPEELRLALTILDLDDAPPHEVAWAYWALCWLGRKGKGGTNDGVRQPSVRWSGRGGTNASRIKTAANDLRAWTRHFERCEWVSLDFNDVLAKVKDEPTSGIYCDPPWFEVGKRYVHRFEDTDHVRLRESLDRFRYARVLVRYGDHPVIRRLYAGWKIEEGESRTQAGTAAGELWITRQP
ncbi:D12 class N6 adenine-specific DNA methyltransferase [Crateriforma conspicua]|uniref:site-specific DNA-methyltransferase (adenine-specific) n=1 Tax=Crateriforma conspicua TaxID=2527996 RepID=A0A5C6FXW1_9PLAN|nr:DNA adenine methylase [Crateriforma conspicua]TWU66475.1 D12 class N6 adenine-specific DNA methyltransferase [Crateriforma conspicua]